MISEKDKNSNLRVMSSNLLFDKTAPERREKLFDNYMYYLPDIIGMQEVNGYLHETLIPALAERGYVTTGAWPDADNKSESEKHSLSRTYPDVNYHPIVYRRDRFETVETRYSLYRSTWTKTKGFTSAVLRDSKTGKLIGFVNTHAALLLSSYKLENMSDRVDGAGWRRDNVREMLEERDRIIEKYGKIPCFFTGDFNGGEEEPYYSDILNGGMLNAKYAATEQASMNICSFHFAPGEMPNGDRTPIDHIFVTPDVKVYVHSIETRQEALDASDHCIVYADVKI